MNAENTGGALSISEADEQELTRLVKQLKRREGAMVMFAIAPNIDAESAIVQQLRRRLEDEEKGGETFDWRSFEFNQEQSFYQFLDVLESQEPLPSKSGRRVVMVFGLEDLLSSRMVHELQQLNLGRERLFRRDLVLVFWLKRKELLSEFRSHAQDFWDWRVGKVFTFEMMLPPNLQLHPHQTYYPYLDWVMDRNRYIQNAGIRQVQKQIDMPLDQVYVSLQAERPQPKETDARVKSEQDATSSTLMKEMSGGSRDERTLDAPRDADRATAT